MTQEEQEEVEVTVGGVHTEFLSFAGGFPVQEGEAESPEATEQLQITQTARVKETVIPVKEAVKWQRTPEQ